MANEEPQFEAGPFGMTEEQETRWPRSGTVPGRTPMPRPSPVRDRRRRRTVRPAYLGPFDPAAGSSRCEVLLVLEGYPPSSPALAAHHEPALRRLAGDLRRTPPAAIEVVAVGPSSQARRDGDLGDRRTEAVVRRLKTLLQGASGTTFRRLARQAPGPSRVEIRICTNE